MKPKLVILCGGQGSRLRPLTADLPKPLVPLNGKPILQHLIEFYLNKEFRNFILCIGFRAEVIEEFIRTNHFPVEIEIANAGERASMLRRLYEVRHLIGDRAMVTYGDTFINVNPAHILQDHEQSRMAVTITVADVRSPFGIVQIDAQQRVLAFDEKPLLPYYIGHMVMERRVLDELDEAWLALPDGEGLVRLFQYLAGQKQLHAYRHTGLQITFNSPLEWAQAEARMVQFFTQQESG